MRLTVRAVPNAKKSEVIESREGFLKIKLHAPAVGGKANKELVLFLSDYLHVPKSRITIVKGEKGRDKIVEVL